MHISILGGGAFGTALAIHFAKKNYSVKIWEYFQDQAEKMQTERVCPLLPQVTIPSNVQITSNIEESVKNSDLCLLVVPSNRIESTIDTAKKYLDNQPIIICSKGFGNNQQLLSDVVKDHIKNPVFCLYGPTLALELAQGQLSGMVLAGEGNHEELKAIIENENLRVKLSNDIVGIQIGSALKNVVTIFVGIVEGMGLGENAKAYVFTKGIEEISKIGLALGAHEDSFYDLTCMGDLTLNSRNRQLGIEIGKGKSLQEVMDASKHISEGVIAIENATKLNQKLNLHLPIIEGLHKILFGQANLKDILKTI